MDYNARIKEKLGKLLFLEMNIEGFKKNIGIPSYVELKNKELYMPIDSKYISNNIQNEIRLKSIPIYSFIEGMFVAMGCDENLRFNDDYELILDYIKDTESCIKSLISNKINKDELLDAYLLLKGYYSYSKDKDVYKKLLLVGEAIREKDNGFAEILINDIEYCEKNLLKIPESYLYKAMILKEKGEFAAARVALNEYLNNGGKETEEIKILSTDIVNISDYERAIELLDSEPSKTIEILLRLSEEFDENPLIYYYLGIAFRKLENYDKAIYYLEQSVKRESGILEVIVELGVNYACIGQYERAITFFKKAFEASRDVEICTNIIMCYLNLNDKENAKLHLEIAKNLNGEDEIVKQLDSILKDK